MNNTDKQENKFNEGVCCGFIFGFILCGLIIILIAPSFESPSLNESIEQNSSIKYYLTVGDHVFITTNPSVRYGKRSGWTNVYDNGVRIAQFPETLPWFIEKIEVKKVE